MGQAESEEHKDKLSLTTRAEFFIYWFDMDKSKNRHYKFFCNKKCEYYPCHELNDINCLFCFCPLFNFECGGDFVITSSGRKDCSKCLIPHTDYDFVIKFLKIHRH